MKVVGPLNTLRGTFIPFSWNKRKVCQQVKLYKHKLPDLPSVFHLIPSLPRASLSNFLWYLRRDSWMTVAKCKVEYPKESSQHQFLHFLDVCLSTLSEFFPAIQEIDVLNLRPWFAGHTSLWANLSHWICLLHRSSFQDNPQPKAAKKIL